MELLSQQSASGTPDRQVVHQSSLTCVALMPEKHCCSSTTRFTGAPVPKNCICTSNTPNCLLTKFERYERCCKPHEGALFKPPKNSQWQFACLFPLKSTENFKWRLSLADLACPMSRHGQASAGRPPSSRAAIPDSAYGAAHKPATHR